MHPPVGIGVVGCGAISGAYFEHAAKFPILKMVAASDINMDAARAKAQKYGVPKVCTVEELMNDPQVEIVLNLTVPKAHAPVALAAIEHGKHTYCEKPLAVDREEGQRVLAAAKKAKLRIGCAPDTVLGAGHQTARKLIDDGAIGRPVAFTAFMMCPGHESWHPSPEFYYEVGGGPMFDMGPYYLTALLNMLGPVKRLLGSGTIAISPRTITSQPKHGKQVNVETPDHIAGILEFANGAMGTIMTSFAVHGSPHPRIIVFGTEGTLDVPDPNGFDGPVKLRKAGRESAWQDVPHTFIAGYGRAVGLADMATALRTGRPHRCSGAQAMAVLDLMQGFLDSSASGKAHKPKIKYERPAPMRADAAFGVLED
jgi:predicted dehydrogenase